MRVGVTLYGSLGRRSGGFRYDRRLVEGLRDAGDEVAVVELPWRTYPRGLLDNVSPAVRRRLDVDVDVMIQDELAHPSLVRTNRHLSYPIVSLVHHLRSEERRPLAPAYRAVEARYLSTVDGVVCNSDATRATVVEAGRGRGRGSGSGPGVGEVMVAPPAGDRFDPDVDGTVLAGRASVEPLRLVFVGNLVPRKGLDTLLGGLAAVDADWTLTVVGRRADAGHVRRVRRRIGRAGLGSRVRMAGELSDDDLAGVLRRSHALAVPSRYEGFGIVYLEAMSFGLPVVATAAGGAGEVVTDGETGFLVAPGDERAVAEAVRTLAVDRDRLLEMGRAARRRYEAHPGWGETVDRVRGFIADVAERPVEATAG